MINLDLAPKEWMELNAKLQQKKSEVRKSLAEKGVLKKDRKNEQYGYSYLSEGAYKAIFTELFPQAGLELKVQEAEYTSYVGSGKMTQGRIVKMEFILFDTETGFFESTIISGEGLDSGDKAGYKAYTGALKYYLANTFMVATGDDAEKDSPVNQQKPAPKPRPITKKQIDILKIKFQGKEEALKKILDKNGVSKIEDMTQSQAVSLINSINKKEMEKKNETAGNQPENS